MENPREDNEMTTKERLSWLRERGVLVETAEERRAGQIQQALQQEDSGDDDEVAYVRVPADTSRPMEQLVLSRSSVSNQNGDILMEHLKSAFATNSGGNVDISLLQKQSQDNLVAASGAPLSVSDEALQKVAAEASVESFTLVHPTPSNKFTAIHIYLDEVGMLKRLSINKRAAEFAERVGFSPPPTFFGDVFLGRVQHKPIVKNVSFCVGIDTAMDAPWMKSATTENLEYQMEKNKITGQQNQLQPMVAGGDGKAKQEDGFCWTQTEEELEVRVPVPIGAKAKSINVKFLPRSLGVRCENEKTIAFSLFEKVDVDSGTWTIDRSTSELVIILEKGEEALWPRIID